MTLLPPSPAVRAVQWIGYAIMLFLAVAVAAVSARFLLPDPPFAQGMQSQLDGRPIAFLTHVAGGVTALVLGGFQFVTRQGARRKWHVAAGRIYVIACLAGAVSGLIIAWYSFGGPIATVGFSGLAVAWFVTTGLGWREIMAGNVASHRRWMLRSYALTLAAITLRLQLAMPSLLDLPFIESYRAISFLCWVPNLLLAELWISRTSRLRLPGVPPRTQA